MHSLTITTSLPPSPHYCLRFLILPLFLNTILLQLPDEELNVPLTKGRNSRPQPRHSNQQLRAAAAVGSFLPRQAATQKIPEISVITELMKESTGSGSGAMWVADKGIMLSWISLKKRQDCWTNYCF